MGLLIIIVPLLTIPLFALAHKKRTMDIINAVAAIILLMAGFFLTKDVLASSTVNFPILSSFFNIDALSMFILDIVFVIVFFTGIYSIGYLDEELKHNKFDLKKAKVYYMLMNFFIFTMILSLTVRNMGVLWIAIEATTLASVFLVGFYKEKKSIEAAWKYVIICSVGIAIALLGIIFLHLSYVSVDNLKNMQLDWLLLFQNAKLIDTNILRFAFIFILIGFGTKAGLVPMHTWLPDAHSQAPSPISALLSGVLLNSAVYAIIRTLSIVNKNMGNNLFTGKLLITIGLLSIATAALFILTQKDYKRLLAFSSIEHIGIITLSLGIFTPMAVFGALLHMVNHSLTKSLLFLSSGNIFLKYNSKSIGKVRGLLKVLPLSGLVFFLGLFAIAGTPPFSIFASEVTIITAIFNTGKYVLGGLFILLLAAIFTGIALTMFKMFYPSTDTEEIERGETNKLGAVAVGALLLIIIITGFFVPDEIMQLITDAQKIVLGG